MSDFIKVNLESYMRVARKENVIKMTHYKLQSTATIYIRDESDNGVTLVLPYTITREEYGRLCKELGANESPLLETEEIALNELREHANYIYRVRELCVYKSLEKTLIGGTLKKGFHYLRTGVCITKDILYDIPRDDWLNLEFSSNEVNKNIQIAKAELDEVRKQFEDNLKHGQNYILQELGGE